MQTLPFLIDNTWTTGSGKPFDSINPAEGSVLATVAGAGAAEVDAAVAAARKAFASFSLTTREQRIDLLERIAVEYQKRYADMAAAITEEMGAPGWLAQRAQAAMGIGHIQTAIEVLKNY